VLLQCNDKLKELQGQFQAAIGELIQESRDRITQMWNTLHYSESQRTEEFEAFSAPSGEPKNWWMFSSVAVRSLMFLVMTTSTAIFTEGLLEQHDAYALHLASEVEAVKPILKVRLRTNATTQDCFVVTLSRFCVPGNRASPTPARGSSHV